MKQCSKCREHKPTEAFSLDSHTSDGRHHQCRACRCQAAKDRASLRRTVGRKTEEVWPRDLTQSLLDLRAKTWGGPVNRSPMRWAA